MCSGSAQDEVCHHDGKVEQAGNADTAPYERSEPQERIEELEIQQEECQFDDPYEGTPQCLNDED